MGMFIYNITIPQHINFIFTNRALNDFINYDYDFTDESDIVAQYINVLKSCALRIGTFPMEIFFNEKFPHFPLLIQSIRFFNHEDSLVTAAVKTIY